MSERDREIAERIAFDLLNDIPDFLGMTPDPWVCDERNCGTESMHVCDRVRQDVAAAIAAALSQTRAEAEQQLRDAQDDAQANWQSVKRLKGELQEAREEIAAINGDAITTREASMRWQARAEAAEAALVTLREAAQAFVTWWRDHRDGSPNAAYARVDRFVAALASSEAPSGGGQ